MPLRVPVPVAWIILGFVLDDSLAQQLRSLTRAEVSLVHEEGGRWVSYGSTHGAPLRADLTARLTQAPWNYDETFDFDLVGDAYLTRVAGLGGQGAPTLAVLLQRPLGEALAPCPAAILARGDGRDCFGDFDPGRWADRPIGHASATAPDRSTSQSQ